MGNCSGAVLMREGLVLLGWRSQQARRFPSCWNVLGGHLEPGGSFEAALLRGIEEEAGVVPTEYRELGDFSISEGELKLYLVTAWSAGEPRLLGPEHSDLRWFQIAEAARLQVLVADELR